LPEGKTPPPLSLASARRGSRVEVLEISGGRSATRVLAQLGIRPAVIMHVLHAAPLGGPVMVESNGGRVAIGRGLARKILVKLLPSG
jgi:ferrous iron transport protein A